MTFKLQGLRRPNPVFSDEYRAIIEVLKTARRASQLSQRELGARLGKSQSHVARIEWGERRVDTLELFRMAKAFGMPAETLFLSVAGRLEAVASAGVAEVTCRAAEPGGPRLIRNSGSKTRPGPRR
jgi:transcriptional regulator with XRE-family HTH domain